ncbi:hypothetical protein NFC81_14850 [Salinispirillum sp. LH 10-3-1]|uniref:Uncharacterized protein n=1 Tax=Salinispirillum sp. LH 10-3-1 TaxID=2952525 RepID=A0AB38YFX4_9GAMM
MIKNRIMMIPQEDVNAELIATSVILRDLLPDPSLGPMERIERLARVIEDSVQIGQYHRTARIKLKEINDRLDDLVPHEYMTAIEKIKHLVSLADQLVPEETERLCQKLQYIGDRRLRDNGSVASPDWSPELMNHEVALGIMRTSGKTPNQMTFVKEDIHTKGDG